MRETITQDYHDYFYFLNLRARCTWNELMEKIQENSDFEVGVTVGLTKGEISFYKKKDGERFKDIEVPKQNLLEDGGPDIDPNKICHEICRVIKENKVIKRPRKLAGTKEKTSDLKELRRLRDNLSLRIRDWKKSGKDVSKLENDLKTLKEQIKEISVKK